MAMVKFVKILICISFVLMLDHPLSAEEVVRYQEGSKANFFLDKSFQTQHSDSIMLLLDSAIFHSLKEQNADIYIESLVEKGLEFVKRQNGDSANKYLKNAVFSSRDKAPAYPILAKAHHQYGSYLSDKNEYETALNHLDSASQLYYNNGDTLSYAKMISLMGGVHDNNGSVGKALKFFLEASEIYERYGEHAIHAGIINNVAVIYKKLGDLNGALDYYDKSINLLSDTDDQLNLAISRLNRAMLYKDFGRLELALNEINSSLKIFEKEERVHSRAVAHHNLAEVHALLNNLDSVLYHVEQSQQIAVELEYWPVIVSNQIILAEALRDMGRYDVSNKSALRAYELASKYGFLEKLEELTALMAANYEALKDYKSAMRYFKEFKQLGDTLLSLESQEQVNRLRTEYDVQQKEEDIKNLELINTYQSTLAEKEKKLKYMLVAGIIFSMLVIVLFFYLYRRQRKFAKRLSAQKNQLAALNKEKDDLIAMVAHDLRSPLNNIKGLLGIIKESDETERIMMIELANQSTNVLRNRINQILDVEAINVGRINLKIVEVEVSDILNQLTRHISPEADKKQISFYANSLKNLACRADENYLLQVLENLCTNAIKFSRQHSEIYVKVTEQGDKVRFEVEDQGQGIPQNEIKKLFERYARISTSPTENESSTGLGLPIVKKYVEAMKGRVWCESVVGEGSSFFVELQAV